MICVYFKLISSIRVDETVISPEKSRGFKGLIVPTFNQNCWHFIPPSLQQTVNIHTKLSMHIESMALGGNMPWFIHESLCFTVLRSQFNIYGCFQKKGYPQIIHFNRVFPYKPSILGYHYFWKHPYIYIFQTYVEVYTGMTPAFLEGIQDLKRQRWMVYVQYIYIYLSIK